MKKCIRIQCFCGLGNQLFQYACGRAIQEKYGGELYIDIYNFQKDQSKFEKDLRNFGLNNYKLNKNVKIIENNKAFFNLRYNILLNGLYKILPKKMFKIFSIFGKYVYLGDEYIKINKNFTNNYYIYGYWQSEKYFSDIRDILQKEFSLKKELKDSHKKIIQEMKNNNSVVVHIRRGDYLVNEKYKDICNEEYYKKAVKIIKEKVKNPIFYVFSDDIEYVKQNWKLECNVKFIDEKNENYEEINLMRHCKHYIMANSSFSWWGQYLSENSDKIVIAPKKWYNNNNKVDIYMDDWITI